MSDVVLSVEGLSKRYRIGVKQGRPDTLVGAFTSWAKSPLTNYRRLRDLSRFGDGASDDVIWALRDVTFDVKRGEVLGIVGRNGAGKSTLLKILSRITDPSAGRVVLDGRVSSLLEVGTGFHPELTGRENVYLNGTILGMTKDEVDRKFDEIVDFSGVEKFIDTPVKRYSSGMQVRLAFSVAAHLEPDILLVDEVLAVGDAEFRRKCIGKMGEVVGEGRTILFVSHNMATITALCNRCILIEGGHITENGLTHDVVASYIESMGGTIGGSLASRRPQSGEVKLTAINFRDLEGSPLAALQSGQSFCIAIQYEAASDLLSPRFVIGIKDSLGNSISFLDSSIFSAFPSRLKPRGEVTCRIEKLPLPPGNYWLNLAILTGATLCDHIQRAAEFSVVDGDFYNTGRFEMIGSAACLMSHDWKGI